jgi:NADP-dependent 3-hydroxy acid dehydrogenase YdfG
MSSPRETLKKDNLNVEYIHLDVTDQGSITAAREQIEQSEGRLDVLVNNAGMYSAGSQTLCSLLTRIL